MSRRRADSAITTRNSRKGLKPRKKAYWRNLAPATAIGYRRLKKGGYWMAAEYLGDGRYREERIGEADDALPSDGITVFDFEQAKKAAVERVASWRAEDRSVVDGKPLTVHKAVETYITGRAARESAMNGKKGDTRRRMAGHVFTDPVADILLYDLAESDLVDWRVRRPARLAASTVKRIVTDFKAALNLAARTYRKKLPPDFAMTVKHGLAGVASGEPVARDGAALPDAEVRRIVGATALVDTEDNWAGDLLRMILTLASTGARFSQCARLHVGDLQIARSRLLVPTSRKGRAAGKTSHTSVPIGSDVLELLRPAAAGRKNGELLLERWRHRQEGMVWVRDRRGAWGDAAELQRPWAKIIRRAGLPSSVTPYSLRHSSIVRMLRKGLPTRLVAAVHDTSTEMLEKHYSGAIYDLLDDVVASAIVPLAPAGGDRVVPLRSGDLTAQLTAGRPS